ncbi:MAG: TraB/GumN family protein [Candidatus Bathyarchaeia archaeon]
MFIHKTGRLTVIGTIHVSKHSEAIVNSLIDEIKPKVVAVELCEERYFVLKSFRNLSLRSFIKAGVLWSLIWLLEFILSVKNETILGSDMLRAVSQAKRVGARVEFMDMPVSRIIRMLKDLPLKERINLMMDSLATILITSVSKKIELEFTEGIRDFLKPFKNKYPSLYKCLIDERNRYMAKRLESILSSSDGEVIAVVGLAHVDGLLKELKAMV